MTDPMLTQFAKRAEMDPESVTSLTLIVGGQLFSGDLVGLERFAEEHPDNDFVKGMFSGILKNKKKEPIVPEAEWDAMADEDKTAHLERWTPKFINLISAYRVGQDESHRPSQGVPMRFRASEVQGFFFGKLERSES